MASSKAGTLSWTRDSEENASSGESKPGERGALQPMYWFLKATSSLIGRMSSEAIERLAGFLAVLVFDVLRIRRRLVMRNLELAFGPELAAGELNRDALVRIGRNSVRHFCLTAFEFLRSSHTDIAGDIEVRGAEHLRGALDQGKGAYVLCFHLGNWEAMGAKMTRTFCPSHVLVKRVGSGGVDRFVTELRERNGFLTVKRQKKGDGFTAIKDILARGELVGFVMDQSRPGEPKLPFFGHPAQTNTSFAAIWRRERAPIIPAFIHRRGVSRHILEFFPEVEPVVSEDAKADVEAHSILFNKVVEEHVRKHPDQYFWMHNRWKLS